MCFGGKEVFSQFDPKKDGTGALNVKQFHNLLTYMKIELTKSGTVTTTLFALLKSRLERRLRELLGAKSVACPPAPAPPGPPAGQQPAQPPAPVAFDYLPRTDAAMSSTYSKSVNDMGHANKCLNNGNDKSKFSLLLTTATRATGHAPGNVRLAA